MARMYIFIYLAHINIRNMEFLGMYSFYIHINGKIKCYENFILVTQENFPPGLEKQYDWDLWKNWWMLSNSLEFSHSSTFSEFIV